MTVETPAAHRPVLRDRNFILLALVLPALVVLGILWFSGWLKPDPRVALVTAGSNPYW